MVMHVHWTAHSDVTVDNRAYVDAVRFTQMTHKMTSWSLVHLMRNILYNLDKTDSGGKENTGCTQRVVRFQKLTRNLFLTLHGHNVHRQQRQLSKFLMRYQQFASHAYCGDSFQDGVSAGKGFLCAPFWGVQICDYSARFRKDAVRLF